MRSGSGALSTRGTNLIFRPSAQTGSTPFTCMFSSLVSCLLRLYGHSEYQPMRASFSSRCDEYYNLKMLLIGE